MIFRELNGKLYEITLPAGVTEEQFLEKQKSGTVKFIQVNPEELPSLPESEQRQFSKIFFELDGDNIVIDYERTIQRWIEDKYKQIESHIYNVYPQSKQNSDLADKLYYESLLKAKGIKNPEAEIKARVDRFFSGETLEAITQDVPTEVREAYLQLIKTFIRITWVQLCKSELKKAIAEGREPNFPEYPLKAEYSSGADRTQGLDASSQSKVKPEEGVLSVVKNRLNQSIKSVCSFFRMVKSKSTDFVRFLWELLTTNQS